MALTTPKRFTLDEYHRLTELGFFAEGDRVELIRGEIIQMPPKGTPHVNCCRNLLRELAKLVLDRAEIQCQDPIVLPSNSQPEPDLVILQQRADNYLYALPTAAEVLLVIEIADSTLKYDQAVKASLYAEAAISNYWIFNLVDNYLEAYTQPYQDLQGNFGYSMKQIVLPSQAIALPHFAGLSLDLAKVFPGMS